MSSLLNPNKILHSLHHIIRMACDRSHAPYLIRSDFCLESANSKRDIARHCVALYHFAGWRLHINFFLYEEMPGRNFPFRATLVNTSSTFLFSSVLTPFFWYFSLAK